MWWGRAMRCYCLCQVHQNSKERHNNVVEVLAGHAASGVHEKVYEHRGVAAGFELGEFQTLA